VPRDNYEARNAVAQAVAAVETFSKLHPGCTVHTVTVVSNGQHGGWDVTVQGTEPTEFDDVEYTEIVR
jgi:hypothetical protein